LKHSEKKNRQTHRKNGPAEFYLIQMPTKILKERRTMSLNSCKYCLLHKCSTTR